MVGRCVVECVLWLAIMIGTVKHHFATRFLPDKKNRRNRLRCYPRSKIGLQSHVMRTSFTIWDTSKDVAYVRAHIAVACFGHLYHSRR